MKRVTGQAFARAGLLGNPSDGYHGKTISFIIRQYAATIELTEANVITILPMPEERKSFTSIQDLRKNLSAEGYYGSERLIKAALKKFADYFGETLDSRAPNFSVSVKTNIPRQVGMAGSSAIIIATLRAALSWFGVSLPPEILASLALSVERDELGIPAGLQDRVVQAFEGLVFMDFSRERMSVHRGMEVGVYEPLPENLLRNVYVAYTRHPGEPTEVFHSNLKARFAADEPAVVAAMQQFAQLAEQGKRALQNGDEQALHQLINANFDLRQSICRLNPAHVEMVEVARSVGASAKYCGSGGAIVGTYSDEKMFERLVDVMNVSDCHTLVPHVSRKPQPQ
jgi:glucuronokinase